MKLLLSPDGEGGGAPEVTHQAPVTAAASPGGAPPAGSTVANGRHTEAENELRKQLDAERTAHGATAADKKKREQHIAELQDELQRLKAAAPAPWRYRPFKRTERKEA